MHSTYSILKFNMEEESCLRLNMFQLIILHELRLEHKNLNYRCYENSQEKTFT